MGGPSVVALCGRFDGGVDPIPDDLGRDALGDPVKDLGLGNPIAGDGNAQVTSALRESPQKVDKTKGPKLIETAIEAVVSYMHLPLDPWPRDQEGTPGARPRSQLSSSLGTLR